MQGGIQNLILQTSLGDALKEEVGRKDDFNVRGDRQSFTQHTYAGPAMGSDSELY